MADSTNLQDSGIQIDNASPTGVRVGQIFFDKSQTALVRWNGTSFETVSQSPSSSSDALGLMRSQQGSISAIFDADNVAGDGLFGTATVSTGTSSVVGVLADGLAISVTQGAATTGQAAIIDSTDNGGQQLSPDAPFDLAFRFSITDLTTVRFVAGPGAGSPATRLTSDAPDIANVLLQFSTDRGDTTFQWSRQDDAGGSQTLVDSAVTAVAGTVYICRIQYTSATSVTVTLYSAALAVLDQRTFTTNIPLAASADMGFSMGAETRDNVLRPFRFYNAAVVATTSAG